MKSRVLWACVALAALGLAALVFWPNKVPPPSPTRATSNAAAPATGAAVKKPKPEVAIQEGKTIDFSSGAAVVKDDAKQKAAIDKAVKEMESAAADVTFGPTASAQKKVEPTPAPPKP